VDLHGPRPRRAALLRVLDRYGKFGTAKFKDAARRLGHPMINEQKYPVGETDFRRYLHFIHESNADAMVIWGDAPQAGLILKQMQELGMKQRVFASFRVFGEELLQVAGTAAEGLEFVFPYDPNRNDPAWAGFVERFRKRFGRLPDAFAALSFDAAHILLLLLRAICQGLNRREVRDALELRQNTGG
jgi:branched-chain amino acid transport system substrate-binding protein